MNMVVRSMPYLVSASGSSDVGLVRSSNEDFWKALPHLNFYVLADGMGGHRAGEIASKEAVNTVCEFVSQAFENKRFSLEEAQGILHYAIELANQRLYKLNQENEHLRGMGTTLCCIYFHPQGVVLGNVGDSRIYRMRNGIMDQLTRDHSLFRELVDLGKLDEQQASEFLYKNIITKAVGTEPNVEPSIYSSDPLHGDIYLMCSDGLTDMLSSKEIQKIIHQYDLKTSVKKLIELAKDRGGHDNITVVLMKVQNVVQE